MLDKLNGLVYNISSLEDKQLKKKGDPHEKENAKSRNVRS